MALVYDRRMLFTLKLAKNMFRITDDVEREEALSQFPEEVRMDVNRIVRLMKRGRKLHGRDDSSTD